MNVRQLESREMMELCDNWAGYMMDIGLFGLSREFTAASAEFEIGRYESGMDRFRRLGQELQDDDAWVEPMRERLKEEGLLTE